MKNSIKAGLVVLITLLGCRMAGAQITDNKLTAEIRQQLEVTNTSLLYPRSVLRYYQQNQFRSAWIKQQGGMGPTWQAMLTLDCVMAFGLSHDDYHPKQITYSLAHDILDTPGKVSLKEQALFEITLTDALITLMNNLHYGKLNPDYPADKIDIKPDLKFRAEIYLNEVLKQKDLMTAFADVQPRIKLYVDLQRRMQLLKGKYQDDCYEVPESEVRKIAINMERLRWAAIEEKNYVLINIPTYTLTYQLADTAYQFRIAVGRPATPTPVLKSSIDFFATAPDAKVDRSVFLNQILPNAVRDVNYLKKNHYAIYDTDGHFVTITPGILAAIIREPEGYFARHSSGLDLTHGNLVFHFPNPYQVYLHDMPKKGVFDSVERAMSSGCIWLENAGKLGELFLKADGAGKDAGSLKKAMTAYKRKTFIARNTIPIYIIYITCSVDDYGLVTNKDIYNLDKGLEMALYNVSEPLSMR